MCDNKRKGDVFIAFCSPLWLDLFWSRTQLESSLIIYWPKYSLFCSPINQQYYMDKEIQINWPLYFDEKVFAN